MPRVLAQQECPRCDNLFPGGLKRCTACGLDVTRASSAPDAASPWPGFDRGVIECNSCGYSTPDDLARRGRIQKCGQCAKTLYIPSGLYRSEQVVGRVVNFNSSRPLWWGLTDRIGAALNRFSRSKARLPMALLIVVLGLGLLFGLNWFKNQSQKLPEEKSAISTYYDKALSLNKSLKQAESEYDIGIGGLPQVGEFADRASPEKRTRFLRGTERVLKQVEDYLYQVQMMAAEVPPGAENHYAKLKTKLEERQRYYARLKDGVEGKNEARWKEAFSPTNQNLVRETNMSEEQALNQLQAQVLKPVQPATRP